jgi:hypothetical protein
MSSLRLTTELIFFSSAVVENQPSDHARSSGNNQQFLPPSNPTRLSILEKQ